MRRTRLEMDALILATLALHPTWWSARVEPRINADADGHRLWSGALNTEGYGIVTLPSSPSLGFGGRKNPAPHPVVHRIAYLRHVGGPIPDLDLDHLCRIRTCSEVSHLELKTHRENVLAEGSMARAAEQVKRTHCPNGHPLEGDNLLPSDTRRGKRNCYTCHIESDRERAALIREARAILGLTFDAYRKTHGTSKFTAERIISEHAGLGRLGLS